jgi:hypothetical protein
MSRSPGTSAPSTQQLTPWSEESNKFDRNSLSATTPSRGNSTNKRRVRGKPGSEADDSRVSENLAGRDGTGVALPTTNARRVSKRASRAAAARTFICDFFLLLSQRVCSEAFETKAGLRYVFHESVRSTFVVLTVPSLDTMRKNTIRRRRAVTGVRIAIEPSAIPKI